MYKTDNLQGPTAQQRQLNKLNKARQHHRQAEISIMTKKQKCIKTMLQSLHYDVSLLMVTNNFWITKNLHNNIVYIP